MSGTHGNFSDTIRSHIKHIFAKACLSRQVELVRLVLSLAGAGSLGVSLTELLDTTGSGIIRLSRSGRVLEVNDRARDLLRTGDGVFDEGGFLFVRTPEDDADLQGLLARALPPFGVQGVGGSMMVRRASDLPLVLHVNPVNRHESDFSVWSVAALVLIVDPVTGRIDSSNGTHREA